MRSWAFKRLKAALFNTPNIPIVNVGKHLEMQMQELLAYKEVTEHEQLKIYPLYLLASE